jgi:hypothetical protein
MSLYHNYCGKQLEPTWPRVNCSIIWYLFDIELSLLKFKKNKQMKTIYIAFAALFCMSINAQTMFVRPIAGSQTTYPVVDIQKLTFDNGNMLVTNNTGASGTFAISGLRYVSFTDFNLGTTNPELATSKFYAYPNPASHILNISGSNAMQLVSQIEILSLEGRLLTQQNPSNESAPQIDISALPQGMYLCRIANGNQQETLKFLKQ